MKAVFLDRDGIINQMLRNGDSPAKASEFKLVKGVREALREMKAAGYALVIVSNQPGLARGRFTKADFEAVQARMRLMLAKEGVVLDGEYYCFHDKGCECKKPMPGLLIRAAEEMGISRPDSIMIGDTMNDIIAGTLAGCKTILVSEHNAPDFKPNFHARTITEAADIVKNLPRESMR